MVRARVATLRPADLVLRLVRLGILTALIVAAVAAMLETTTVSRECTGAFSRAFSSGFDRYHCDLIFRFMRNGYRLELPIFPR
jgi:hypothetical protein